MNFLTVFPNLERILAFALYCASSFRSRRAAYLSPLGPIASTAYFAQGDGRHSQSISHCRSDPTFDFAVLEPPGGRPTQIRWCRDHCYLQEAQRHQQSQSAARPACGSGPGIPGKIIRFLLLRSRLGVPPDIRSQGHGSVHGGLHPNGLLRMTGYASGQKRISRLVSQGRLRGYQGLGTG